MDKLLLTKADIATVIEDLPTGLLEKRLNNYIRIVQETQLPQILTYAVYLPFVTAFQAATVDSPLEERWNNLYTLAAFKKMLAYLSWAEYLPFAQATVTSNGVVQKESEYSSPVDAKIIGMMITNTRNSAAFYARQVQTFLATQPEGVPLYPEYRTFCSDKPHVPGLSTIIAL